MGMTKRVLAPLAVVAAGVLVAALIVATGPETVPAARADATPTVRAVVASAGAVRMTVTAHGTVEPKSESALVAEVSGRVTAVSPALVAGGFFAAGDVLAEIERIDYEAALEQARAARASARSEQDSAERAHDRQAELKATQLGSEAQLDEALNRLLVAQASLREARAQVKRAERDLQRTRLIAPYDGRVRSERVDVGQFVQRGEAVASLYSTDFAEVRLPVLDAELAFLPLSLSGASGAERPQVVLRAAFAGAERAWPAEVVRTEGELDPRTRMVTLVAAVARPYERRGDEAPLTAGLFVAAEILGRTFDDVVAVPRSALADDARVFVVDGGRRVQARSVDVLRVEGDTVYLRGGVEDGEVVCLSAASGALEGQQVRADIAAPGS